MKDKTFTFIRQHEKYAQHYINPKGLISIKKMKTFSTEPK